MGFGLKEKVAGTIFSLMCWNRMSRERSCWFVHIQSSGSLFIVTFFASLSNILASAHVKLFPLEFGYISSAHFHVQEAHTFRMDAMLHIEENTRMARSYINNFLLANMSVCCYDFNMINCPTLPFVALLYTHAHSYLIQYLREYSAFADSLYITIWKLSTKLPLWFGKSHYLYPTHIYYIDFLLLQSLSLSLSLKHKHLMT